MTDKKIEEIAKLICATPYSCEVCDFECKPCGHQETAMQLANAGYGNVKHYQKEIEYLQTELAHREEDLVHADEKVFYREMAVKLDEDKIKKQAVKEFCEKLEEITKLTGDTYVYLVDIKNLFTQLYGADE